MKENRIESTTVVNLVIHRMSDGTEGCDLTSDGMTKDTIMRAAKFMSWMAVYYSGLPFEETLEEVSKGARSYADMVESPTESPLEL